MISGFDKYFQIARCFRDEDLRADRQPEFTQIDLEMTFPRPEAHLRIVEGFLTAAWKTIGIDIATPFLHMTYDEAIRLYGIDKPDMRLPAMSDVHRRSRPSNLATLKIDPDFPSSPSSPPTSASCRATNATTSSCSSATATTPRSSDITRLEKIFPRRRVKDSRNCETRLTSDSASSPAIVAVVMRPPKSATPPNAELRSASGSTRVGGQFRLALAQKFADKHGAFAPAATSNSSGSPTSPCTSGTRPRSLERRAPSLHLAARGGHRRLLDNDKGAARALAYDIVLNGTELGSGSIRIHRQDVQSRSSGRSACRPKSSKERFGFFLDALEYGTPPHGGIALGLDRIVMILAGATSLREVIAFPKTAKAIDLMVDAPTPVSDQQLKELGIGVVPKRDL